MSALRGYIREIFILALIPRPIDHVDINEGRVIDQKLANAAVTDLTKLSCCYATWTTHRPVGANCCANVLKGKAPQNLLKVIGLQRPIKS